MQEGKQLYSFGNLTILRCPRGIVSRITGDTDWAAPNLFTSVSKNFNQFEFDTVREDMKLALKLH